MIFFSCGLAPLITDRRGMRRRVALCHGNEEANSHNVTIVKNEQLSAGSVPSGDGVMALGLQVDAPQLHSQPRLCERYGLVGERDRRKQL
jgi:hypothetical protein